MPDKEDDNIYSLASRRAKLAAKSAVAPVTPVPEPPPALPNTPAPNTNSFIPMDEAIRRVQQMRADLEQHLDMVYSRMGLNKNNLKRMLDNPQNFQGTGLTYEKAQQQRQILRQQVAKMVGQDVMTTLEQQEKKKEQDRFKKKSLGDRRNWLNMR